MPKKPRTIPELRWDLRELQKKLKKLGVTPPPPKGKPARADIMKPGKFYAVPARVKELEGYDAELRAVLDAQGDAWTAEAFLHNVLAAALTAAPAKEQLTRPHAHVPARPVINNHGYLAAALLAAQEIRPLVLAPDRENFERLLEVGHRVAAGEALTDDDDELVERELPLEFVPSGAQSRQFTGNSLAMMVAQGVALEAEAAATRDVGGKGAREACVSAVELLVEPGEARRFLEKLDALIQLEDAKLQFSKVSEKPSAPLLAARWRGAEKGKSTHWLVELSNGHFALLWKVKGKWRLVEGSREDALACVPDAQLKAAVNALR